MEHLIKRFYGQFLLGIGKLYAIIGVTEDLGSLLSGPCFSFTFHIGLKYGTAWQGMPFLVSTTLLVGVAVVVFLRKLRNRDLSRQF